MPQKAAPLAGGRRFRHGPRRDIGVLSISEHIASKLSGDQTLGLVFPFRLIPILARQSWA
jgi:hypothetical protein